MLFFIRTTLNETEAVLIKIKINVFKVSEGSKISNFRKNGKYSPLFSYQFETKITVELRDPGHFVTKSQTNLQS